MKCIQCDTDNDLEERTGNQGRCKNCNHPFAFEPTTMDYPKFTDPFFAKVLHDISAQNTLFFTPKQLLYLLDQRLKQRAFGGIAGAYSFVYFVGIVSLVIITLFGGYEVGVLLLVLVVMSLFFIYFVFKLTNYPESNYRVRQTSARSLQVLSIFILIVVIIFSLYISSILLYWLATIICLTAFWLGFIQQRRIAQIPQTFFISAAQMQGWLDNWARANGSVAQLLPTPSNAVPSATQNNLPAPDVTAYSFDRVVVCQSDAIAQMLIANNFHFENSCAILSISGYPQRIFDTTMQMLRRNRSLQVFAFHDCSPEDMQLVYQLRTPDWFPDSNIIIVDLGLSPRQILATKRGMFIQNSKASAQAAQNLAPHIRQNLSKMELRWLDRGNFVELESFTPQRLIQVLNRGIASSQQVDTVEDSSFIVVGDDDRYFYATDSFG